MTVTRQVTIETPAKVNLTLEVLGKRNDGYHEIASVMQAINLCDRLTFSIADDLSLISDTPGLDTKDNLVYRAASLLNDKTGVSAGAEIHLCKGIPVAAGLGGGSSDAAATLLGLNRLWGLHLARDELEELAAQLGSDVPFFLAGGAALAEGRGERITPLPSPPTFWLVLAFQPNCLENKTAAAYGALTPTHHTDGGTTSRLANLLRGGAALENGSLFNVFDGVASRLFSGIDQAWDTLQMVSGAPVHLSGAGPTLFCLVGSPEEGERIVSECAKRGVDCQLVRTLAPKEGPRFICDD